MSEGLVVEFPGGRISLTVDADFLTLSDDDLELILQLRRQMKNLGTVSTNGTDPASTPVEKKPAIPVVARAKVAPGKAGNGNRGKYTDGQKAEMVREADESGNDSEVQRKHDLGAGTIAYWRKARLSAAPPPVKPATATGPAVRCPACKTGIPVTDPGDSMEKRRALREHYEDAPECKEIVRKSTS